MDDRRACLGGSWYTFTRSVTSGTVNGPPLPPLIFIDSAGLCHRSKHAPVSFAPCSRDSYRLLRTPFPGTAAPGHSSDRHTPRRDPHGRDGLDDNIILCILSSNSICLSLASMRSGVPVHRTGAFPLRYAAWSASRVIAPVRDHPRA